MKLDPDRPLTHLLDGLEQAADGENVSIADVRERLGNRAITPFILLIAVMMITPISGIPGVPTLSAVMIITLATQALFGRRRLWLPKRLLRLEIASSRVKTALSWIRRPCAFLDRNSRPRLALLTNGLMRWVTLLLCVIVPLFWPLLEFLPFFSSFGATIVSLFAFGLLTRDGIYVLAGYCLVSLSILVLILVF